MRSTRLFVSAATCACLALVGCSEHDYGPTGTITGKLTFNGKPLDEGTTVSFMQPEAGFLAFGATDAEGNFTVKSWNGGQMPVGTYKVMVQPPGSSSLEETDPEAQLAGTVKTVQADFPAKYRAISTSDLSYEVKEGENNFEVELKSN